MISKFIFCLFIASIFQGLSIAKAQSNTDPTEIISRSIELYGGQKFDNCKVSFDFRNKSYSIETNQGLFEYKRIFNEKGEKIEDILNNQGFKRFVDGEESYIAQLMSGRYSSSINSVVYFALLPFRLSDEAVNSTYLGEANLEGKNYHKIKVTFSEESGGDDFEDVFIYWFSVEDYSMDYLAYSYHTGTGGIRFRKAYNKRSIGGLTFQDYDNYKADLGKYNIENLDFIFEKGELELLSKIELENLKVN